MTQVNITVDGKVRRIEVDHYKLTQAQRRLDSKFFMRGGKLYVNTNELDSKAKLYRVRQNLEFALKQNAKAALSDVMPAVLEVTGEQVATAEEKLEYAKFRKSLEVHALRILNDRKKKEAQQRERYIAWSKRELNSHAAKLREFGYEVNVVIVDKGESS